MIFLLNTIVAAAARSAAMEAANHSKNSAMEADTISKHGARSKSQMSRIYINLIACFVLLTACLAHGQINVGGKEGYLGIRAGANFATWGGDHVEDAKYKLGFQMGLVADFPLENENLFIQPGFLFSQIGVRVETSETRRYLRTERRYDEIYKVSLNYIQIPVNIVYKSGSRLLLNAGPYLGFGLGGKATEETSVFEEGKLVDNDKDTEKINMGSSSKDDFKGFDFGLGIGVGMQLNDKFQVGAGYNLGLVSIIDDLFIKNRAFSITLTYVLGK